MSNAIQFLESLGRNPAPIDYVAAVAALDVDEAQRQALMDRNHAGLNDLLGGRPKMLCLILPADEPAPEGEEQPEAPAEETPPTEQ
jgi:hypothetical protein